MSIRVGIHAVAAACTVALIVLAPGALAGPTLAPPADRPLLIEGATGGGPMFTDADGPLGAGGARSGCTTIEWTGEAADIRVAASDVSGHLAAHLDVRIEVAETCGHDGRVVYSGTLDDLARPGAAEPVHLDGPGHLAFRIDVTLVGGATPSGPASADFVWTGTAL